MSRSILALIGAGCLGLTGCGTFSDAMCGPIDNHVYYRGVRLDIEVVKEGGPMALMAADIPFSAVADTLLIPYYARRARPELPPPVADDAATGQTRTRKQSDDPSQTGRPQN
jgi:uncharacterized protein YceK